MRHSGRRWCARTASRRSRYAACGRCCRLNRSATRMTLARPRELDHAGVDLIVVEAIPERPEW